MKLAALSLVLSSGFFLVACGGSSGGGKNNSSSSRLSSSAISSSAPSSQPSSTAALYSLAGSISGLDGSVKLLAGSQTLTITDNGNFSFPTEVAAGTQVTLSLSDAPFRQQCSISSPTQITVQADVSNISVACNPLGTLTGNINNYHTGTPIDNAQVTVTAVDAEGNNLMNATAQTDATGAFRVEGLGISNRFVLTAWGAGFSTRSEVFSNTAEEPNVERSALVLKANYSTEFAAGSSANLVVDGQTLVQLPANAFVTANGSPATGNITPSLTIIDPSGDANVMPGNYEVRNPDTGAIELMESYGALDASFRDASGNLLQLAPGTSATLSIPVASRISTGSAPATVPLFYFDETIGYWVQEGEATLVQENGQYFYRGTVTHFTTWNADRIYETVNLSGCVRDANQNPVANARIVASGRDYIGQSTGYSNADGTFTLPVRINSDILVTSISGSQSDTIVKSSGNIDFTVDECLQLAESSATITLTWGENPSDLDSHWLIPAQDGSREYQVYFGNKTQEVNGVVFDLDVDDVSSFGPEVVTVPNFPHAGTYRYVVHRYAGSGTIASSPARVELNLRGRIYVYSPTNATGNSSERYWHVFNIQVDESGNATPVDVQRFTNSRNPVTGTNQLRNMNTNAQKASAQDSAEQDLEKKETKYYAE